MPLDSPSVNATRVVPLRGGGGPERRLDRAHGAGKLDAKLHGTFAYAVSRWAAQSIADAETRLQAWLVAHPHGGRAVRQFLEVLRMEEASLVPALSRDIDQLVKFSLEEVRDDQASAKQASDAADDEDDDSFEDVALSVMDDTSVSRKLTRVTFRSAFAEKYSTELHEFHARCSMATEAEGGPVRDDLPRFDMLFDVVLDAIFSVGAAEDLGVGPNAVDIRLILVDESRHALMTELGKALAEASRILDAANVPSYTRKAAKKLAERRAASGHTIVMVAGGRQVSPGTYAPAHNGSAGNADHWPPDRADGPGHVVPSLGGVHALDPLPAQPHVSGMLPSGDHADIAQIRRDIEDLKAKSPPTSPVADPAADGPSPSSLVSLDAATLSAAADTLMRHGAGRAHVTAEAAGAIARQRLALASMVLDQYESTTGGGADAWALLDALRPLIVNLALLDPSFVVSLVHPARMAMDELALVYSSPVAPEVLRRSVMDIFNHLNTLLRSKPASVTFRHLTLADERLLIKHIALQREGRIQVSAGLVRCALATSAGGAPSGREVVFNECVDAAACVLASSDYSSGARSRLMEQIKLLSPSPDALDGHLAWVRGSEYMDLLREAGRNDQEARWSLTLWQQKDLPSDEGVSVADIERRALSALVSPYRWFVRDNADFLALAGFDSKSRKLSFRLACGKTGVVPYELSSFFEQIGSGRLQPLSRVPDLAVVRQRCRLLAARNETAAALG